MKYKIEVLINKPRAEVWKLFCDREKIAIWQPVIIAVEPISGGGGQPGSVSKWVYKANDREFFLTERVVLREEPNRFESIFENEFAENTVANRFMDQGNGQTLWVAETKYKFKTLFMKLLGPFLKKRYVTRSQKEMERFKKMVEES